ncbi:MAG: NERD domain-containing protein [Gammaproteobacteria bacterium]|nr:NERD domain-containing protein [Gammaproteobacteria bacterium]
MELEAISGAATVALTSTIVFLLIAKTWNTVARTVASTPSFSDRIMREAAQRFRDELERLSSSQQIYLSGSLVFVMLFVAAYLLKARELFAGYPSWQLYLQLGFIGLTTGFAIYRLCKTVAARYRVSFVRDANIAVGHQLQQLSAGATRVYHDVETSAGVVDHVIVSQNGVYAINVVARRSHKRASARLIENTLQFSNGKAAVSIVDIAAKSKRLQKEFRQLLGHKVRVRSVIALPGWEIGEQSSYDHLLVNERNLAMLSGWKDNSDHLMNEDADLLHQELRSRCLRA